MPQQMLEYESPTGGIKRPVKVAAIIALSITLLVNGVLVAGAAADGGLGAVIIAWVISPIANGVLAVAGLAFLPLVKRRADGGPVLGYGLISTLGPVLAIGIDIAAIATMDIHVHMC